jgi:hypothetical protein
MKQHGAAYVLGQAKANNKKTNDKMFVTQGIAQGITQGAATLGSYSQNDQTLTNPNV